MKREDPFFVSLDEVPQAGRTASTDLELEWLARLLGTAYSDAGKEPHVEFHVVRDRDNLVVKGIVDVDVSFACSRCGEPAERHLSCPVKAVYVPEEKHRVRLDDFVNDDEELDELFGYQTRAFSIEQPFVDALALALDPYPCCSDACPGVPQGNGTVATGGADGPVDARWGPLLEMKKKLKP
jgi:uncharacterized metal-binding protein YceD (DUF177 family)